MQNLFFSGHNLSRKGNNSKQKHKNNTGGKKIKASHFAVETVGTSMGMSPTGPRGGAGGVEGSRRKNHKRK